MEDFAEIARINHKHSKRNPYSQFKDEYTLEQIMKAQMIHEPLTKLQCCPTSDGGAAAVIVSQEFLDARPHLKEQAILIACQCLATDAPSVFDRGSISLMGYDMTKYASAEAYKQAGIGPEDVQVVELHDCFSANEMIVIDALGLSPPGKAHELVRNGDITYGGKYVINSSGGLISKGHPLGATGIAQCAELCWHLRGWANNRLVKGTKVCLQHNLGLGGAVVVTVYKRADGKEATPVSSEEVGKRNGLGMFISHPGLSLLLKKYCQVTTRQLKPRVSPLRKLTRRGVKRRGTIGHCKIFNRKCKRGSEHIVFVSGGLAVSEMYSRPCIYVGEQDILRVEPYYDNCCPLLPRRSRHLLLRRTTSTNSKPAQEMSAL